MSRVLTQQFICKLNKVSQKSINAAKHPKILLDNVSLHESRYITALERRFCHTSNVAAQVNSNQVDASKQSNVESKILHATAYQTNGEMMVYIF